MGVLHRQLLELWPDRLLPLVAVQELGETLDQARGLPGRGFLAQITTRFGENAHTAVQEGLHDLLLHFWIEGWREAQVQIDQQLPRVISGALVLAIEGYLPEAWHSYELFEVENLYFPFAEIEMPLVPVDQSKVSVEALGDPS